MSYRDIGSSAEIGELASMDAAEAASLWISDPSNGFYARVLVRATIIHFEAFYSVLTSEFEAAFSLVTESTREYEDIAAEFLKEFDLGFTAADYDFLVRSRSDNVNANNLKRVIKLAEKMLKTEEPYPFDDATKWKPIHDLFELRHDYTHPKVVGNFNTERVSSFFPIIGDLSGHAGQLLKDYVMRSRKCVADS